MIWLLLGVTLEGTISNPEGLPVEGASIAIYDHRFRLTEDLVVTDSEGHYSAELEPGQYRVRVLPPRLTTGSEIWNGGTLVACESDRIDPAVTPVVDVQLPQGGGISGSVFFPDRTPYTGVEVVVYPLWHTEISVSSRRATTDVDGRFLITGLPPDAPRAGFVVALAPSTAPEQYHRSVFDEAEAQLVSVPEGSIVDLPAFTAWRGATLSGTVSDPMGPLANAEVVARNQRGLATLSDEQGHWTIENMPPGPASISARAEGHARTFLGDVGADEQRVQVPDRDGGVGDLQLELPPEATVSGRIGALVGEENGGGVLLRSASGEAIIAPVSGDGSFVFVGLFAGTYALESWGTEPLGYIAGRVLDDGGPVSVVVSEGESVDIGDHELRPSAGLQGTVFDDEGDPVVGAAIILQQTGESVRHLAFTRDDGSYLLQGVEPGIYDLQVGHGTFCDDDATYVSVFWPELINPHLRRSVQLDASTLFEWSAIMPVDADRDDMSDAWERQHGLDPGRDDADEDPDDDGFTNLQEYRLGTDPNQVYQASCGCSATSTAPIVAWISAFARR